MPIGVQSFEDLRRKGFEYVDKTAFVWDLANLGKSYFLSRPRRFGKSSFSPPSKPTFRAKKSSLTASRSRNWKRSSPIHGKSTPMLHLDLNAESYTTREDLLAILDVHLTEWEKEWPHTSMQLKDRYSGYRFAVKSPTLYNPFSLAAPFAASGKTLIGIGASFNEETRTIAEWREERL